MMMDSQVDLLSLRDASLPRLLEALDQLATQDRAGKRQSLGIIADLAVDEVVRLVRKGSRSDLLSGGGALVSFLAGPRGRVVRDVAPGVYDTLSGILPVLTAASSPASKGGEELVLRTWGESAQEALVILADAPGGVLPCEDLGQQVGIEPPRLPRLLADLEGACLIERMVPYKGLDADVHLTAKGRNVSLVAAASD